MDTFGVLCRLRHKDNLMIEIPNVLIDFLERWANTRFEVEIVDGSILFLKIKILKHVWYRFLIEFQVRHNQDYSIEMVYSGRCLDVKELTKIHPPYFSESLTSGVAPLITEAGQKNIKFCESEKFRSVPKTRPYRFGE